VPRQAADCHFHVYDARFPLDPKAELRPADATVDDYLSFRKRIGTSRGVLVQPSTYGLDNRLLLESLGKFGRAVRGVAVVNTSVSGEELKRMNEAGVRRRLVPLFLQSALRGKRGASRHRDTALA
jgi:predicted TIM-barrel fold metal-dependent hydrolase